MAEGVKAILEGSDFAISDVVSDMTMLDPGLSTPDLIVFDPAVVDYQSRSTASANLKEIWNVPVVAIIHAVYDEDIINEFDGIINLYDSSQKIVRKLHDAVTPGKAKAVGEDPGEELSAREKEILVCIAKGMLNKEIAYEFNISIYTVMTHRKNITRKTGIKTVAGLTVYAILNGLIDIGSIEG